MANFELDIEQWANKTGVTLGRACRGIKIGLFNGVIRDTRVDTGRLRGNWQTSTGSPKTSTTEREDKTKQYDDGGEAQDEVINNVTAFGVDYMTNNLPYAAVWDRADGTIDRNMARINRIVKKAVDDAK